MSQPVFVVSGASRGIGRAVSAALQRRGAVVVAAARNVSDPEATDSLLPVAADLSEGSGRRSLVAAAVECRGSVVNVSSVTRHRVLPNLAGYATSKAVLDHFTRSQAVEWGPDGIRVNTPLPWITRTALVKSVLKDRTFEEKLISATPLAAWPNPRTSRVPWCSSPGQTRTTLPARLRRSTVATSRKSFDRAPVAPE